MKKGMALFLIIAILSLQGCQKESVYTLDQEAVSIEVHTKDFDPLDYLRKDGEKLSDEDKKAVKTSAAIDTSTLHDAVFQFPEYQLKLTVHVVDTQAPSISLIGFKVEKGKVFTWNEETYAQLKADVKDNYDYADVLKKSLHCGSVDTQKLGKQTVTCSIEDTSGNKASDEVVIEVVEKMD